MLFGAAPAPAPGGGLFGAATGGGLFGAAPAPAPGGGLFGAAPAPAASAGGLGGFGGGGFGIGSAAPAAGNPFGGAGPSSFGPGPALAPAAAAFSAPSAGGLFGAKTPAPASGLFGGAAPAAAGSLFGGAAPAAASGLFGSAAPAAASGLFGGAAPAAAGGLFGSGAAPAFGAPAGGGGLFGAAGAPAAAAAPKGIRLNANFDEQPEACQKWLKDLEVIIHKWDRKGREFEEDGGQLSDCVRLADALERDTAIAAAELRFDEAKLDSFRADVEATLRDARAAQSDFTTRFDSQGAFGRGVAFPSQFFNARLERMEQEVPALKKALHDLDGAIMTKAKPPMETHRLEQLLAHQNTLLERAAAHVDRQHRHVEGHRRTLRNGLGRDPFDEARRRQVRDKYRPADPPMPAALPPQDPAPAPAALPPAAAGAGLFGGAPPAGGGLFAPAPAANPFGGGGFGGAFGAAPAAAPAAPFGYGSAPAAAGALPSAFGAAPPAAGGLGPFGGMGNGAPANNLFGSTFGTSAAGQARPAAGSKNNKKGR